MKFYECACPQCRIRGLQGPLILIAIGVLFSLDHIWNLWSFSQTWPMILIVMGLIKVFERLASDAGHGMRRNPPGTDTGEQNNAS